jgi:hypothetical protein
MMGCDWGLRTATSTDLLFIPRWYAMWTTVWWYRLRLTPNLSTRALWLPPVLSGGPAIRDISRASGTVGEGNENLVCPSPWDFKRSLRCRKILRHGTFWLYFPSEGMCVADFITLKNSSTWPSSNPQTLGPVASTLATTPPRRLVYPCLPDWAWYMRVACWQTCLHEWVNSEVVLCVTQALSHRSAIATNGFEIDRKGHI